MEEIIKHHDSVISEVFESQQALDQHENECSKYGKMFSDVMAALKAKMPTTFVYGSFGSFCPYLQFFTLDALFPQDWPNNISANSIYIAFKIDFRTNTVEVSTTGHIYLSEADQKKSYLCMCSMKNAHQAMGGKWMRKSKFKSPDQLAEKVEKFWLDVMASIEKATGGYPYKQMQVDIY